MTTTEQDATRVVLDVRGLSSATESHVVEAVLRRRPAVQQVDATLVAQTATGTYDPAVTSVAASTGWVRDMRCALRRAVRPGARRRPDGGAGHQGGHSQPRPGR